MREPQSIYKRAKASQLKDETAGLTEATKWLKGEQAELAEDVDMDDTTRAAAERALRWEWAARAKRSMAKAKRDNALPKFLEREARDEIAREKAAE